MPSSANEAQRSRHGLGDIAQTLANTPSSLTSRAKERPLLLDFLGNPYSRDLPIIGNGINFFFFGLVVSGCGWYHASDVASCPPWEDCPTSAPPVSQAVTEPGCEEVWFKNYLTLYR